MTFDYEKKNSNTNNNNIDERKKVKKQRTKEKIPRKGEQVKQTKIHRTTDKINQHKTYKQLRGTKELN